VNEFASNVERHRRELLLHCYLMLGSLPDAEDAVQETLLRAWRYRDTLKEGAPMRPGLYRVATNERLPRKYDCGVVPSIVRNISMKALTLS
jgi:DNA-directed RNA polymerase specialized sigma24 family protein